jgi:nicotinate phosphoribosyltransferase
VITKRKNMKFTTGHWGLYTDFYELTMAQGYFCNGNKDDRAVFNYFFRTNPFGGGFTVFAGLQDFLGMLENFTFGKSDINYLRSCGFDDSFLNYLKDFRFSGNIQSVNEGEIVFPNVPVLQVEGNIIEAQLIESFLLNILNFESLIATKAYRVKIAAGEKEFTDFGLRRAQGLGALQASRASFVGGASSTSNVLAGKIYGIPVSGTQAHSWIQSFDDETEAFRSYAKNHPENTILLVDTYDTLKSGVPNAIKVAKEMEEKGYKLKAVRLDSGDLAYLSKKTRKMLDDAGLSYVRIVASNQLNEYVIKSLIVDQNAPIDFFGVGTEMITGKNDAALDGVYKLTEINGQPKMKLSDNVEKVTLPAKKQVIRYFDKHGKFYRDAILIDSEDPDSIEIIYHPLYPELFTKVKGLPKENLLNPVVLEGTTVKKAGNLNDIHNYLLTRAALLAGEHKRFISPHLYKAGISEKLMITRNEMAKRYE